MHGTVNTLKTALLFGVLGVALVLIGGALGGTRGLVIGLVIALAVNGGSYWFSDRIALASMRARPVSEAEQPGLYAIVRELSNAAHQPMPRLYVSPTSQPNAFATGRNPKHAAVCVTEGILGILDRREMRAVLGHELSHVYNRDILLSSVAGALAAAITYIAQFALFFGGGGNDRDRNQFGALLMLIVGPIAATLIQLSISRSREYQADESGAKLSHAPLALASALQKLQAGVEARPLPQEPGLVTTSHLMIANPFRSAGIGNLFATHPPMDKRIARLQEMAKQDPSYWQ